MPSQVERPPAGSDRIHEIKHDGIRLLARRGAERVRLFTRNGNDVVCDVPIGFTQAALGAEIDVPTPHGKVKMKVPAGTQSGNVFRLKGKGVPDVRGYGHGDTLARVVVETPKKLSARQRELLEEFARLSGEEVHPISKGFLDKVKEMFG